MLNGEKSFLSLFLSSLHPSYSSAKHIKTIMDSSTSQSNDDNAATLTSATLSTQASSSETDDLVKFLQDIGVTSKYYQSDVEPSPRDRASSNAQPLAITPGSSTRSSTSTTTAVTGLVHSLAPAQSSSNDANNTESGRKPRRRRTTHQQQQKDNEKDTTTETEDFLKWLTLDPKANINPKPIPQPPSLQTSFHDDSLDSSTQSPTVASSPPGYMMPPSLSNIGKWDVSKNPSSNPSHSSNMLQSSPNSSQFASNNNGNGNEIGGSNNNSSDQGGDSNNKQPRKRYHIHHTAYTSSGVAHDLFSRQISFDLQQPAMDEDEAKSRLEELLSVGEQDPESIALGCFVKDNGWYIPANIRRNVWKQILAGSYSPSVNLDDVYSSDYGDRMSEKIKILEETNDAMGADIDEGVRATAAHVVFEYCMKNKTEYVRAHSDLGAISMQAAYIGNELNEDGNLLYDCNLLFDTLSKLWGGPTGDWSALIGIRESDAYPAALGAAWCPWTKSVEANTRRTSLFSLLLNYHDPELARFVTKQATYLIPAVFGILSNIDRDSFDSSYFASKEGNKMILSLETRTRICDAILLRLPGFSCPQEACFFFSLGAFMLYRDDILSGKYKKGDVLFPEYNDRRIIYIGSKAASITPQSFRSVLAEYELPLIPSLARSGIRDLKLKGFEQVLDAAAPISRSDQSLNAVLNANPNKGNNRTGNEPTATDPSKWLQPTLLRDTMSMGMSIGNNLTRTLATQLTGDMGHGGSSMPAPSPQPVYEPFIIEFNNSKPLGMDLAKHKTGLTVIGFSRGADGSIGQAEESGKISIGDLILSVNGVNIALLTPGVASAVVQRQNSPYFMVFATTNKNIHKGFQSIPHQPLLKRHLMDLYQSFNAPLADKKADRVIKLYAGREAILLQEILSNYGQYVKGDPSWTSFSTLSIPVTVGDIIHHLCQRNDGSLEAGISSDNKKYMFVDCRSTEEMNDMGRFRDAIRAPSDDTSSRNAIIKSILSRIAAVHPQPMHVCIIGSGVDALYKLYDPKRARKLFQDDRRDVDNLALSLLSKGIPLVSIVTGGFLACLVEARKLGFHTSEVLTDRGPSVSMDAYDAYLKFIPGDPISTAEFITAASREFEPIAQSASGTANASEVRMQGQHQVPKMAAIVSQAAKRAHPEDSTKTTTTSAQSVAPPRPTGRSGWNSALSLVSSATHALGSAASKAAKTATTAVGSSASSSNTGRKSETIITNRALPVTRTDTSIADARELFQIED